MNLCALATVCILGWYGLVYICSYISTGLFPQVPNVPLKINLYLVNTLWSIAYSYYYKLLLSEVTLHRSSFCSEHLRSNVYVVWRPAHVFSPIFICSKIFFSLNQLYNKF